MYQGGGDGVRARRASVAAALWLGAAMAAGGCDRQQPEAPETRPGVQALPLPLRPAGWLGQAVGDPAALPGCQVAWERNKKPWGPYRSWHCRAFEGLPAGWATPANLILDLKDDRVLAIKLGLAAPPKLVSCQEAAQQGGWRSCGEGAWWARLEPVPGGVMLDLVADRQAFQEMRRQLQGPDAGATDDAP